MTPGPSAAAAMQPLPARTSPCTADLLQGSTLAHEPKHANNFDAIRIFAACMVLFSHHFALTAQTEPSFFKLHTLGGMSVIAFFIISGYLVTSSWYNDSNFLRFAIRRVLRIWPALTLVVAVTAYGLGAWATDLPIKEYWLHRATFDYLGNIWMKIHYQLPGVFNQNPYASGVNGSLWTIPLEVRCYTVLAVLGLLRLLKYKYVFILLIAIYWIWFLKTSSADVTGSIKYGRELSAYFLAGAALYIFQSYWEQRPFVWACGLIFASTVLWVVEWKYTAVLVGMPYLVIYFGTRSFPFFRRFGRWGDPSYGIYLIAFPIQQTVILRTWPTLGFWSTLFLALFITTTLAYASWHGIEKQALRFKPHRR